MVRTTTVTEKSMGSYSLCFPMPTVMAGDEADPLETCTVPAGYGCFGDCDDSN